MSTSAPTLRWTRRIARGDWRSLIAVSLDRLVAARPALRDPALAATVGRVGLEIGGPSRVFTSRGMVPVYRQAARIDNVNFGFATLWEERLTDGGEFHFCGSRAPGTQFIREAVSLTGLEDGRYDFILSSHCLEHVANPLAALREWQRVSRAGACLVLILPDPARTFDHRRPVTTLEHLRHDFERRTKEDDQTHFDEVLALHDITRDPGVASREEFRRRVRDNAANRGVHHHVFDLALMTAALAEAGWRVLGAERARPLHLVALARKERT